MLAEQDDEDRDYYRRQTDEGMADTGQAGDVVIANELPEQYDYAHPGEIGSASIQRPPVVNRRGQPTQSGSGYYTSDSRTQLNSQTNTQLNSQLLSEQEGATQEFMPFSQGTRATGDLNFDSESAFDPGTMASQGTAFDSMPDEDFTQHLNSQMSNFQTQEENPIDYQYVPIEYDIHSQPSDSRSEDSE